MRRDLERRGALETVRSDIARGKALEFLIEHATVVDEEGNVIDIALPEELANDEATETTGGEPAGIEPAGSDSTEERA